MNTWGKLLLLLAVVSLAGCGILGGGKLSEQPASAPSTPELAEESRMDDLVGTGSLIEAEASELDAGGDAVPGEGSNGAVSAAPAEQGSGTPAGASAQGAGGQGSSAGSSGQAQQTVQVETPNDASSAVDEDVGVEMEPPAFLE